MIAAGSTSNSSATSARIAAEQVISASALFASHHSTECTWRDSGADSQPANRPASVAWNVATSGTPSASASAIAGCATSQSWACTTSGRQPVEPGQPGPQQRVAQRERPGHEVALELQVRRVLGHREHPHAVDDLVERGVGRGVGARRAAREHDDLVPGRGQGRRERVHVPPEPADHDRRILPD